MGDIFSVLTSGLTSTYSQLASMATDGLTLEQISNLRYGITDDDDDSSSWYSSYTVNQSFASYLQTNFSSIDSDGDGILSSDEITTLTTQMSAQGYTLDELTTLYASGQSGLSEETMTEILENFSEIDANGDGRVTSSEVSGYKVTSAKLELEEEYRERKLDNMSIFYGSST